MKLLLDTSTPTCYIHLVSQDGATHSSEWEAGRTLAHALLAHLQAQLEAAGGTWTSLEGIGVMRGPGSFTGLRIGLAVVNTVADDLQVPIVGATGEGWRQQALARLQARENDRIVLPLYGADANITTPRK